MNSNEDMLAAISVAACVTVTAQANTIKGSLWHAPGVPYDI